MLRIKSPISSTGRARLEFDPKALRVRAETLRITDPLLAGYWGNALRRLVIRPFKLTASGRLTLILRAARRPRKSDKEKR